MAIVYTVTPDGDRLLVQASGFDETLAEVQDYGMAVIGAAARHGATRILCDESRLEYRLGVVDTYEAAQLIAAQAPAVVRVAIVCNPEYLRASRLFEDVAVNRGLTLRMFGDMVAASDWLNESPVAAGAAARPEPSREQP